MDTNRLNLNLIAALAAACFMAWIFSPLLLDRFGPEPGPGPDNSIETQVAEVTATAAMTFCQAQSDHCADIANRIRGGEFQSDRQLLEAYNSGGDQLRQHAFQPVFDITQQNIGGSTDQEKMARHFDAMSGGFGSVVK